MNFLFRKLKEEFDLKDPRTMAYINMFGVLGTLENLCEMDNKAKEIIAGIKPVSVAFEVKDGPSATFHFTNKGCRMVQGVDQCDVKLPFSSCEKFNGLIEGTVTPIPSKGFTKIGFLLKKFTPLTNRLSEVMRPSEEALKDERMLELNTKLMLNTICASIAAVGNYDEIGMASASYMVDGDVQMAIKNSLKVTVRVKNHHLTAIKSEQPNPRAVMQFDSIKLANDLFNGRVNALACIGEGTIEMHGFISLIDNLNRILDRVSMFF